jgi:glycosyltransferase involved in cell wall biosynthesis
MGNETPLVTVIIPVHNRSHLIGRAIQSVINQTYDAIELLVVDDGSTDTLNEVLNQLHDDRITCLHQSHLGPSAARNNGFAASKGEYVHFLDSDDYFLNTNISRKVKELTDHPQAGWVFSDCFFLCGGDVKPIEKNKNIAKLRNRLFKTSNVFRMLLKHYFVNMDTVIMRRECIESIGGFDETLPSFEDMDFFYRLAQRYQARFIDEPLVTVSHQEPDSLTGDLNLFYSGKIQVIRKMRQLFPEETRRVGFPGRKVEADLFNYLGKSFRESNKLKEAFEMFLKSVRTFPLQRSVYGLMFTTLFRILETPCSEHDRTR